jgi:hypothetical protein
MKPYLQQTWAGLLLGILVAMIAGSTLAHGEKTQATEAEAFLDVFNRALSQGDGERALGLLSQNAVILEGGVAQTRSEYAEHHLGSDMAFLAKLQQERLSRQILQVGGAVVIITRTQLSGYYEDREIDVVSAETAVIARANDTWEIRHLHWSS